MTPEQALALEARQAVERLDRLTAWLERARAAVGPGRRGVHDTLAQLVSGYRDLEQANDEQPMIAVLGENRTLAAEIVAALTRSEPAESDAPADRFAQSATSDPYGPQGPAGRENADILRRLLLGASATQPILASVRYVSAALPPAPRAYPFRLGLLGLADLAAILVRMHQGIEDRAWRADGAAGTLARLQQVRDEVGRRVQPASYPGFTEAQVIALQDMVERAAGDTPRLSLLAAAGYWRDLAEVAAHLNDADRVRVLAQLWGEDPQLTAALRMLVEATAVFGHAREVHVASEALMERDAATGWLVLHPDSILRPATLARLGLLSDASVRVVGRYGHPVDVARAVLAAVVSEIALPWPSSALAALTPADVLALPALAFPATAPTADASRGGGAQRAGASARAPFAGPLAGRFAEAKARHLADCACRHPAVTTLLACLDPDALPPDPAADALPDLVASWIEEAQGGEPGLREACRTGLYVLTTDAAAGGDQHEDAVRRRGERLLDALAGDLSWPREWTPGQPFMGTFTLALDRNGEPRAAAGGMHPSPAAATIAPPGRPRAGREPMPMAATRITTHADAERLIDAIAAVSDPHTKQQRLRRQMAALHRRTRARLMRFEGEGAPLWLDDWRRRIAAVLEHRLVRIAEERRLGRLLAGLGMKECELVAVFRNSEYAALDGRMPAPPLSHATADDPMRGDDLVSGREPAVPRALSVALADDAVSAWLASIRRRAGNADFARCVGLTPALMAHLIDEVAVGALRVGLVRRLAQVVEAQVVRRHGGEVAFAGIVAAVINGFVESLALAPLPAARTGLGGVPVPVSGRRPRAALAGRLQPAAHALQGSATLADRWCAAFMQMVADNIASSRYWPAGEARPDLARIMAEFPQIPFEVEL